MIRMTTRLRRAISLSLPIFVTATGLTPSAFAETPNNNHAGTGFTFTNPTTNGSKTPATNLSGNVAPTTGGERVDLGSLVDGAEEPAPGPVGGANNEPGIDLGSIPGRAGSSAGGSFGNSGGFGNGGFGNSSGGFGGSNIPANNPYAPWTPFDSYGNGRPGMLAIPQTMVPGTICPLVDSRPNPEILQAIEQLFQYVIPTGNCRSEKDQTRLAGIANQMKESGKALKDLYGGVNTGEIDSSTIDLAQIQGHIQSLVGGMDTLGSIVTSSPLSRDPRCGQADLKGGELLKAMGNLVTSIAPYALLLASIGTAPVAAVGAAGTVAATTTARPLLATIAKPALKYLLGTFAVGSVASFYSDLISNGTMDMDKPDQREALLQNLCEFFRIEQRVTYLKQADMGNVRNINERLRIANQKLMVFKAKTQSALEQNFPKDVLQLAIVEAKVSGDLLSAQKIIRSDRTEMAEIKKARGNGANNGVTCALGKMLAKKAADTDGFPGRSIKNYQFILSKQTRVTTAQELLLQTEIELRESLKGLATNGKESSATQCAPGTQCKPNQRCADIANDYVENIQNIIEDGNHRIGVLKTSLTSQLSESPGFKEFKTTQTNIKREIQVREKTGRLIALLAGDNAATVREEIDRQMDLLKKTLFSSSWPRQSPVMAWLSSSNEQYRLSLQAYASELDQLIQYAGRAANPKDRIETFKDIVRINDAKTNLSNINAKTIKPGSEISQNVCRSLNNLTLEWHTSLNHLKSQKFFCDSIREMMDVRVQKSIREFCFGNVNPINGAVYSHSEIESNFLSMGKNYGSRARLIDSKYKELQCEAKDATEVMQ